MTLAHLDDLRDCLFEAVARGDEIMIETYQREIDSVEALLGEMEMMKGQYNV